MTVYELQNRFNQELEKHGIVDPVMSSIVEDYLNYSYNQYVTSKYDSLINPQEKFEITERISRILAPILKDFTETVTFTSMAEYTDGLGNVTGWYVTGPVDLQYIIREYAIINTTDCDDAPITLKCKIIPIKHNQVNANSNNPFLKPERDEIWRLNFSGRKIELIGYSGITLDTYYCRYIKKLTAIDINAGTTIEIDDSVHEEIAVNAAYLYMASLSNDKTKKNET